MMWRDLTYNLVQNKINYELIKEQRMNDIKEKTIKHEMNDDPVYKKEFIEKINKLKNVYEKMKNKLDINKIIYWRPKKEKQINLTFKKLRPAIPFQMSDLLSENFDPTPELERSENIDSKAKKCLKEIFEENKSKDFFHKILYYQSLSPKAKLQRLGNMKLKQNSKTYVYSKSSRDSCSKGNNHLNLISSRILTRI